MNHPDPSNRQPKIVLTVVATVGGVNGGNPYLLEASLGDALMPGNEQQAAGLLDSYLTAASSRTSS
jgi:hypothetical protein